MGLVLMSRSAIFIQGSDLIRVLLGDDVAVPGPGTFCPAAPGALTRTMA